MNDRNEPILVKKSVSNTFDQFLEVLRAMGWTPPPGNGIDVPKWMYRATT